MRIVCLQGQAHAIGQLQIGSVIRSEFMRCRVFPDSLPNECVRRSFRCNRHLRQIGFMLSQSGQRYSLSPLGHHQRIANFVPEQGRDPDGGIGENHLSEERLDFATLLIGHHQGQGGRTVNDPILHGGSVFPSFVAKLPDLIHAQSRSAGTDPVQRIDCTLPSFAGFRGLHKIGNPVPSSMNMHNSPGRNVAEQTAELRLGFESTHLYRLHSVTMRDSNRFVNWFIRPPLAG